MRNIRYSILRVLTKIKLIRSWWQECQRRSEKWRGIRQLVISGSICLGKIWPLPKRKSSMQLSWEDIWIPRDPTRNQIGKVFLNTFRLVQSWKEVTNQGIRECVKKIVRAHLSINSCQMTRVLTGQRKSLERFKGPKKMSQENPLIDLESSKERVLLEHEECIEQGTKIVVCFAHLLFLVDSN